MTHSDRPVDDEVATLTRAVENLTAQVARLCRGLETGGRFAGETRRSDFGRIEPWQNTIHPPRMPQNLSWHERMREKRVSLPAAGIGTAIGWIVIEIGHAFFDGRLRFW